MPRFLIEQGMAKTVGTLETELHSFLTTHLAGLDSATRTAALAEYARGLGLEIGDKSMMAMARSLAPENVEGCRQRMQRAVTAGRFDAADVFGRLQATVSEEFSQFRALCVDDTGIAKQGDQSVGVQRQYSGTLGKVGNCQVITTLHAVSNMDSCALAARLYLPESWANDSERRQEAQVPEDVVFQTKPEVALEMISKAVDAGIPKRPVLADAAFGDSREFRDGVQELGLDYAVGVSSKTMLWPPEVVPSAKPRTGKLGRPPTRFSGPNGELPVSARDIADDLMQKGRFRRVTWRHGTKGNLTAKFARVRVRSAERWTKGTPPSDELCLLIEINPQPKRPFKFYLSSLPEKTPTKVLVDLVKMRWRIEMDYRDLKQHLGFDEFEGRTWGGLHRHLAMVFLMHCFIALNKERFSPRSFENMELEPVL